MDDWFIGQRNWIDFWELIERLPVDSCYKAARLEDADLAADLAGQPRPPRGEYRPGYRGYSATVQRLDDIADRLSLLISAHGGSVPLSVRPVTALDEAESAIEDDEFDRMVVAPSHGK